MPTCLAAQPIDLTWSLLGRPVKSIELRNSFDLVRGDAVAEVPETTTHYDEMCC